MSYRKYDPRVKRMIIASKNPNLFPELKIPRTTALYWIKQGYRSDESSITDDQSQNRLQKEVYHLRATNLLLMELLKSMNPYADFKSNSDNEVKRKVVEIVESLNGFISKKEFFTNLGLSSTTYFRWRSEILGCEVLKKKCSSGRPYQLTREEQKTLVSLAKDSSLRHLSTKSLMYYAQRNKILSCGLDTWYKYMKIYKVTRITNKGDKKKKYLRGLRAEKVNQIWHIDVTEFRTIRGQKLYLQLIVDNYSRAIVSWKVSDSRGLELTLNSLKAVKENHGVPIYLLSDAGKENANKVVRQILIGKGITQLIAKSEVVFSNSMVEAVFRQLKQKFILYKLESKAALEKAISNFVQTYNFKIPHSSLKGGTPVEVFHGKWDPEKFFEDVLTQRRCRMVKRTKEYNQCNQCLSACG